MCSLALTLGQLPAATWCVTVAGLGGEPDYEQRFASQAKELEKLLKGTGPDVQVQTLLGPEATKAAVRSAIEGVAAKAKPEDSFILSLIGHGTFDGNDYKFNIPGPDITATDLATWLDRIPAQRQLVMNGTSASGASVHALQKPNRTWLRPRDRDGEECHRFPALLDRGMRDPAADTDKNEVISALEAFKFAELRDKAVLRNEQTPRDRTSDARWRGCAGTGQCGPVCTASDGLGADGGEGSGETRAAR